MKLKKKIKKTWKRVFKYKQKKTNLLHWIAYIFLKVGLISEKDYQNFEFRLYYYEVTEPIIKRVIDKQGGKYEKIIED